MPSPVVSPVLRSPRLWIGAGLIIVVVSTLFSLLYVGGNVNPSGDLRNLPVAVADADSGATVMGHRVDFGASIVSGIEKSAQQDRRISWRIVSRSEAQRRLDKGKVFGALVIPQNFSASVVGLGAEQPQTPRPSLTVLTNRAAGSLGSSMASQATEQVAQNASVQIGKQLLATAASRHGARLSPAAQLLLADPVSVQIADGHPLRTHSGLGLTPFYYALVLVVIGMLGSNVISSQIDTALGYLHSDFGPLRMRMPLRHTSRARTLATSSVVMLGLSVVAGSLVELMTVGVLGMDASHLWLLWIYSVCAVAVVGMTGLALLAVFGSPGMLLITLIFIAMAVPSSGATVPLQALPGFFRGLAEFEPLRQLIGGVRSIVYFNAQGDAGLTRAWVSMALALVAATLFGFGLTSLYDHKGLHRVPHPVGPDDADADVQPPAGVGEELVSEGPSVQASRPGAPSGAFDDDVPVLHGAALNSDGHPVAGVVVTITDARGRQLLRTHTDRHGRYFAAGLPEDFVTVVLSAPQCVPAVTRILPVGGRALRQDFVLAAKS